MSTSVLRAIKILDCFEVKSEMTLNELTEVASMPKTTVFRLAASLEEGGLLVKEKKSSHEVVYRMGLKLLHLGNLVSEQLQYSKIAYPHIEKLNKEINELVHLATIEGNEAVYVESIDSTKPVRLVVNVGRRSPLYAGSAPKLLLSSLSEKDLEEYLSKLELTKITDTTIATKEALKAEIEIIRKQGFSISQAEHFKDTVGFSFPLYNFTNQIVAAVGVSIPIIDYSKEREKVILEKLGMTAKNISRELGHLSS